MRLSSLTFFAFIAACTVLLIQSCKKNVPNKPATSTTATPTYVPAAFSYSANRAYCGLYFRGDTIHFSPDSIASIPSGSTFLWNFGDGTISNEEFPVHVYTLPIETYKITLTINNDTIHTAYKYITIALSNGSSFTLFLSGGIRLWNGTTLIFPSPEHIITDSMLSIEVVDSGTLIFLNDTFRYSKPSVVAGQEKILFYNCPGGATLWYYYNLDRLEYSCSVGDPHHAGGKAVNMHSP